MKTLGNVVSGAAAFLFALVVIGWIAYGVGLFLGIAALGFRTIVGP